MIFSTSGAAEGLDGGSQSVVSQDKLEEDLNRFLSLLVTQLQNQDPLDPMDTNEFTSQLVGFAGVEQQINANANLERLLAIQQTNQVASMVSFLGTTAQAAGDELFLENDFAAFTYAFDQNAVETVISIQDSNGQTAFVTGGETGIGTHGFVWDGRDNTGILQPPGVYRVVISATDPDGNLMDVEQTVFGRVTGSGVAEDGTVQFFMGDVEIPLDTVISVNETPEDTIGGEDNDEEAPL